MRGLSSHPFQLIGDLAAGSSERPALDHPSGLSKVERDRAEWHACRETWRPYPPRQPTSVHEPYSLAWFQQIEQRRYARHGRWIPGVLKFKRHRGENILAIGEGLGTDWCRFAEHGAHVHVCSPSEEMISLVRRNLELRGLNARFLRTLPEALPLADESMDVAVLSPLVASSVDAVIGEVFRVLRPGGKIIATVPARYDAAWWQNFWFPWNRWLAPRTSAAVQYSGRALKRLFGRFTDHQIVKRHLRRSDIPHVWRWMLLPFLERIMGRFLVIKAFKPLMAAMPLRAAA
jgi:SAM-dependent methyltransferase